jgi:phosphatidate cytidylyltransferase
MSHPQAKSDLKVRVITALVGAAILLSLIIFGEVGGTTLFAGVLAVGGAYEWGGLIFSDPDRALKRWILVVTTFIYFMIGAIWTAGLLGLAELGVLFWMFAGLYFVRRESKRERGDLRPEVLQQAVREQMAAMFGYTYLGLFPLLLPQIRSWGDGLTWTFLLFFTVWSADSGAYFAGRAFGRRKLFEAVSPKKTLEGLLGGILMAVGVGGLISALALPPEHRGVGVLAAGLAALASQGGDLAESLYKRAYGVKDSGTIFPGHGGFLDRFDGVLVALPVFYFVVHFLGGVR